MISVIVPVYNEERILQKHKAYYRMLAQSTELIFVDGGSTDRTASLAGETSRLVRAPKNRALQMNAGAGTASCAILLFLHADAVVQKSSLENLEFFLASHKTVGGCLTQVLDDQRLLYKWIAFTGNLRARMSRVYYGDQGIFVRKNVFEALDGFPPVRICEDILFSYKLRQAGPTAILPYPLVSSSRRWKKQGVIRTFLINAKIKAELGAGADLGQSCGVYEDVRE